MSGEEGSIIYTALWLGLSLQWPCASELWTSQLFLSFFLHPLLEVSGWPEYAGCGYFPPQVSETLIIPQQVKFWFPLRVRPLKRNRVLWCISKWFHFSSPAGKMSGVFSRIYSGGLVQLLEVKLTLLWGPPYSPWSLYLWVVHADPPTVPQVSPSQHWSPGPCPRVSLHSGKPWLPVFACVSLLFWGQQFAPVSSSSFWIQDLLIFQSVQLFTC